VPFERAERVSRFEAEAVPHLADVYRLARQMADAQRAPDLTQETYLRAWRYFDSFEPGTNCRAWLFRILHNVWADQWRRAGPEVEGLDEETPAEPFYEWEEEFLGGEFSEAVESALVRLPEVYRWAVLLADVSELSYREIAEVMDCPVGTVMSRVNRGRRMLARLLRPERV
jgi:RNA polymerase sigma-70 factor (ECF subfamily)